MAVEENVYYFSWINLLLAKVLLVTLAIIISPYSFFVDESRQYETEIFSLRPQLSNSSSARGKSLLDQSIEAFKKLVHNLQCIK